MRYATRGGCTDQAVADAAPGGPKRDGGCPSAARNMALKALSLA
jgi:hypothetical protein